MAMDPRDLLLPAVELRRRIAERELSPLALVEASLERIERLHSEINAVVTINPQALDDAREIEARLARGENGGPLCGLPVGIKDVTPVAGLRTTFGSPLYAEHVPEHDALVVERLRRAGAVIVGKTNTPELAAGANTFNAVFGATHNPWRPGLSAGGSTGGGAAALATGMIALAEGSDLGGSLRIPASFCGVVGLRSSPGLVPAWPTASPWDTLGVAGLMARTAEDLAWGLQSVAGPDPRVPLHQPIDGRDFPAAVATASLQGARLAFTTDVARIGVDAGIADCCRRAALGLAGIGAVTEEVELDLSFAWRAFLDLRGLFMVTHHHALLDRLPALGDNVRGNIEAGLEVTTRELGAANAARLRLYQHVLGLLERYELLLAPTVAVPPFPVEESHPRAIGDRPLATYVDWLAPTFLFTLSGLPAASVPCGLDARGLPVGLQVVGPPRGEEKVLAAAAILQRRHPLPPPPVLDRLAG